MAPVTSAANRSDTLFSRSLLILLAAIVVLFGYREWVVLNTPITLFYDEAYYLGWAQTPDWGYYSKPPVVAWVIALTTGVFGNAEWAVKLGAPLLYSLTAIILFFSGRKLAGDKAGLYSGLIFLMMPLVAFNSLFITTDAPLLFFWALSFYAFLRALDDNQWRWWLTAALAGGLGLLSKLTFILLPVTFLLYAVFSEQGRRLLQNPRFWIACFGALACLLPNLYWNYQHDFISFQHVAEISQQGSNPVSFSRLTEFWAGQLLVFGPILLVYMFWCGLRRKPRSEHITLLWSLFWPTFIVLSVQALMARANVNWAGPAYVGAALLTGCYLSQLNNKKVLISGLVFNLLLSAAFYHYSTVTDLIGIERKDGSDPYKRLKGWPEFVGQFQPWFDEYPNHKLASDSRKLLAYFGYYLQPQDFKGVALSDNSHIEDHYELKYPLSQSTEDNFLFVSEKDLSQTLQRYFTEVELLTEQSFTVYSNFSRQARLYKVSGFKGINNE